MEQALLRTEPVPHGKFRDRKNTALLYVGGVFKFWVLVPASSGQRCVAGGVLLCAHLLLVMLTAFISPACPQLTDQSWLPGDVKVPFLQVPFDVKGKFRFLPPAQLSVVGSYLLGTCIKPEINVDVAVTMPRVSLAVPELSPISSCPLWSCPCDS